MSDKPKIAVYTCYCGGNISHSVKCEQVAKLMSQQPDVVVSRTNMSLCSDAGQSQIEEDIRELGVNRVVIGACAPSLHEQTFRNTVIRAGLNPYLYHHVGLREQDSWVHDNDTDGASCKACRLMAAGVAKARLLDPLEPIRLEADQQALVIGGGVAGLRVALDIANQGLKAVLVEKTPFLGGRMAQLDTVFPTGEDAKALLADLIDKVVNHEMITIFTQTEVTNVSGYVGAYGIQLTQHSRGVSPEKADAFVEACQQMVTDEFNYGLTERKVIYQPFEGCFPSLPAVDWDNYNGEPIQSNGKSEVLEDEIQQYELTVGAVAVASGFDPYMPRKGEYGYSDLPQVVTLPQLIRHMALNPDAKSLEWQGRKIRDVALIHCVGSREIDGIDQPHEDGQVNNYCSRVCCTATLHMIDDLQEHFPGMNIYDLYQDIRTYGRGHEQYYKDALEGGARFVRYHGEEKPKVFSAPEGDTHPVLVHVKDALTYNQELEIPVDLVVLATGIMPRQIDDIVKMLKISRGTDRFLLEVHPKLRPVETAVNGVILAGTAQGPMNITESMSAASAGAAKVISLLGSGEVELQPFVAAVNPALCDGSGKCVEACEYEDAIAVETFMEDGKEITRAVVTAANCSGCGACVSVCPNRAIDVQGWTLAQYEAMVDAIAMDIVDLVEAG